MAATFADLADEIARATQVFTDADDLQPGKPVHVQVVPGYASAGGLDAFSATAVTNVLQSAVDKVDVSVRYSVLDKSGSAAPAGTWKAVPDIGPAANPLSDPLQVKFLLAPFFTNDSAPLQVRHYTISITITVTVEGASSSLPQPIAVPVAVPGLAVPSLCMFAKHVNWVPFENGDGNHLVIFVPKTSTYPDVGSVLKSIGNLMTTLDRLKDVVDLAADVLPAVQLVATAVDSIPLVDFQQGNCDDFDNINDFDGDARCGLLFGYTGDPNASPPVPPVSVTLFSDTSYEQDESFSTFSPSSGTPVPIGIWRSDDFSQPPENNKYQHGSDDLSGSANSFKWGGV